jgi:hypothetical protein
MMVAAMVVITGNCIPFSTSMASEDELRREILNLKHKVERLEKSRQAVQSSTTGWFNKISLSGLVEVEAGYTDDPGGSESDLTLSTVELGIDAQVTPWVGTHVLILFEEGETDPPEIDEGIITLRNPDTSPFSLAVGRMYVPFGNFESSMISDPLTLEIGETRETAVQVGYVSGGLYGSAYLFNGDSNDGGSEQIDQFGFNLGLARDAEEGGFGYDLGLFWTSNIADSDTLQDAVTDSGNLAIKVAGYGIHGLVRTGPFTLIGEYLTASKSFDTADLAFNGSGAKPSAFNLEADYDFELVGKGGNVAVAWQGTRDALALELPKTRYLAVLSVGIFENTTLTFEYAHDEDYDSSKGGSGEDSDTYTAQLAVKF